MADGPNEVLTSLLDELGWSPRALARRINHVFGVGTVADTAPYHWRDSGATPRPPLPELEVWVLSPELGRPVTTAELWQGRASGSPLVLPSDIDMDGPWSRASQGGHPARVERHLFATLVPTTLDAAVARQPRAA